MSFMDVTGGGPMSIGYNNMLAQNQVNQFNQSMANSAAQNNAAIAAANSYDPWANSPGGFGGQTAYYAGLGADYGRATGGFGGYGGYNDIYGVGYPAGQVEYGGALPGVSYDPSGNDAGIAGWGSSPMYGLSAGEQWARTYGGADQGIADWGGQPMAPTPSFNERFPGYPYSGLPPEIDFGRGYPPNAYAPVAQPQPSWDAGGLRGNQGGGAWDQTDQWGRSYSPWGGYTPPEMSGGGGGGGGYYDTNTMSWVPLGSGGGGWDTKNQWGQNYAPPAQNYTSGIAPDTSGGQGFGNWGGGGLTAGAGGGGAWDTFNMWGQNYAPPQQDYSSGIAPDTSGGGDIGVWGGGGGGYFDANTMNWVPGRSSAGGGAWDTSNMWGQPWAPKDQGRPPYSLIGNGATIPDYNGDMWGGRNAITNTLMQQPFQYPGAGGFNDPSVFNRPGMYQEQPGGWMTTGDPGAGIDGWGFGGNQVQGQQPAPWKDPFQIIPGG